MNILGIAVGVTGLLFILAFMWMLMLAARTKREEQEKKRREITYLKALKESKKAEYEDRLKKASNGDLPTILYFAKEAERTSLKSANRKAIKEALHWYLKAAELDNIAGMHGVARLSKRMPNDMIARESSRFWQLNIKAKEGDVPSIFQVGLAYFHGRGASKNILKAIKLIQKAAKEKNIDAIIFLGDWFSSPKNNGKNFRQAINWYEQAAQLKSNTGRIKLGQCYLKGIGTEPNHDKGVYWLERAAEKGDVTAMLAAGEAWKNLYTSNGTAIAYIWLFIAAHFHNEPAKILRDEVSAEISVDIILGLQKITKPMIKKIEAKAVSTHSIIKALNRLYSRSVPLSESGEEIGQSPEASTEDPDQELGSNQPDIT